MPDVTAFPLKNVPADRETKGADHLFDDAGNLFIAEGIFFKANNNDTWVEVRQYPPGANLQALPAPVASWTVRWPAGRKSTGNPELGHRGTQLTVTQASYTMDSGRTSKILMATLGNVYVQSSGGGTPPPVAGDEALFPNVVAGRYRLVRVQ